MCQASNVIPTPGWSAAVTSALVSARVPTLAKAVGS
jgi:hypothetical protein